MAQRLKLCTWNIQLGLQLDTILQVIQKHPDFAALDLLALQEASVHSDRADGEVIADVLGSTFAAYQVTADFLGKSAQANALVWNASRVQMLHTDTVELPRVQEARISYAERAFLGALRQGKRISILNEGLFGDDSIRVYVAHLDVLGVAHKREQFLRILSDGRTRQPPAGMTILAGDLNTFRFRSRPSWAALTRAAGASGFHDLTSEIVWTHHLWRRVRLRQKLDAIFVRCERPYQYHSWSLDIPGSDHIPVFAEITWE